MTHDTHSNHPHVLMHGAADVALVQIRVDLVVVHVAQVVQRQAAFLAFIRRADAYHDARQQLAVHRHLQ